MTKARRHGSHSSARGARVAGGPTRAPPPHPAFGGGGSAGGGETIARLLRQRGTTAETRVTVLSDGDAGLRAIQRAAAPEADPVLDCPRRAFGSRKLMKIGVHIG